jgi:hypothetical protein
VFVCVVSQAEAVSAWVQEAVEREEERRIEFLDRMQRMMPNSLLQLLQEGAGTCGGYTRVPRMEVHVSARSKRLPVVQAPPHAAVGSAHIKADTLLVLPPPGASAKRDEKGSANSSDDRNDDANRDKGANFQAQAQSQAGVNGRGGADEQHEKLKQRIADLE